MNKTAILLTAALLCAALAESRAADGNSVWKHSGSPASLVADSLRQGGRFASGASCIFGDAHPARDDDSRRGLFVQADGSRRGGQLNLTGSFEFGQDWLYGRSWSDRYYPLSGNPFDAFSELPGDYTRQSFAFSAQGAGWIVKDRLALALGGDYMVGDLSRSRDPRSRSQIADMSVEPAILWKINARLSLGASLQYGYSKEKLLKLSSRAENLDRYKYYEGLGLGEYVNSGIIGFSRRYSGNSLGGSLVLGYRTYGFEAGLWGKYKAGESEVRGETGETPGYWSQKDISSGAVLDFAGDNFRNHFILDLTVCNGRSKRYIQEMRVVTNDQGRVESYWETLLKLPFYISGNYKAGASWSISPAGGKASWEAGFRAGFESSSAEMLQNDSMFAFSRLALSAEGKGTLRFARGRALELSGSAGAVIPLGVENQEDPRLKKDGKTLLLDNVLRPDAVLLGRRAMTLDLGAEYRFIMSGKLLGLALESTQFHTFSDNGSRINLTAAIKLYY